MATFIMLTRLENSMTRSAQMLQRLEKLVTEHVRAQCPDVEWVGSYATLGPYDYLDVFHARDVDSAIKVSTLFRAHGHTHTEIWPATEWSHFKTLVSGIAAADAT